MARTDPQEELPLNDTRASILTQLLGGELSAIDLEDELGINESAIRRHLDTLEQMGYVEHYFKKAKKGRPKKLYRISSAGRNLFPKKTHVLFILLARRVKKEEGENTLENLLSKVAEDFAERLSPEKPSKDRESLLRGFVNSLEKFGFYPSLNGGGDTYYIKYRNCVFGDVREELCDQLCKMHKQIVRNVLPRCELRLKKSIEKGDNQCVHEIKFKEDEN